MPAKLSKQWTADETDIVRREWLRGISAANIAKQLPGRTKSAVIGLVHRENMVRTCPPAPRTRKAKPAPPHRARPSRSQSAQESNLVRKVEHRQEPAPPPRAKKPKPEPYTGPTIAFDDLERGGCRWPVTDDRPARFCARRAAPGGVYCEEHAARAVRDPKGS